MLDVNKLAYHFSVEVRTELAEHIEEIIERNASKDYERSCATHDFCDANMLMFDAFTKAFGHEPMMTYSENFNEAEYIKQIDIWNQAWDQALNNQFKY